VKRRLGYALLAVCAYLVFLIAQLPAAQLYGWLKPRAGAPLQLYQVSGSPWNGRAAAADIGKTRIEEPAWVLRPQALLLGRIEYGFTGFTQARSARTG